MSKTDDTSGSFPASCEAVGNALYLSLTQYLDEKLASHIPPLPPDNANRLDIEGVLTSGMFNGYPVFFVDDCELAQLVAFHFKAHPDAKLSRNFGKMRITIERVLE